MVATLRQDVDEILPGAVADRRWLHENPELGFQEVKTAAFIAERLRSLGVDDVRTGIASTGVTGLIHGRPGGRTILLRADIDALPILEENEVEYRSQSDGVMHACGHDAHTAILLSVARMLLDRRDAFQGTVKLLFQPAEEIPPGGAVGMIAEGVLENPHVDMVFGLHMASSMPVGIVGVSDGAITAAADGVSIAIQGKGGHAAMPHRAADSVVIGAHILTALQTLVSREVDPTKSAVVTIGVIKAGDVRNVIPDTAIMEGTVRTFDPEVRDHLERRIGEVASGVAAAMNASATVTYDRGYASTVNTDDGTAIVRLAAADVVGAERVIDPGKIMAGEDFSAFLQQRPGAFFMVGSGNEERGIVYGHHHPKFDIDEDSLGVGIAVMTKVVLTALKPA
jgi:amidohydrolase